MSDLSIRLADRPGEAEREAIVAPLRAFNIETAGDPHIEPLALLLEQTDGRSVGGLWGRFGYDWLFVQYLAVPDTHRRGGWGRRLMERAEEMARQRHCAGIWLDTYEFQARGFYEKLGFELFGQLADFPPGHRRFFLQKKLA